MHTQAHTDAYIHECILRDVQANFSYCFYDPIKRYHIPQYSINIRLFYGLWVSVEFLKTIWSAISFLLNFFVLFFFKLNCYEDEVGGTGGVCRNQAKNRCESWQQVLKCQVGEKEMENTDFFQAHITIQPSTDSHVVLLHLCFQALDWASRSTLSWHLHVVICSSIHLLLSLWLWWPLRITAKSRCSIWLGNLPED